MSCRPRVAHVCAFFILLLIGSPSWSTCGGGVFKTHDPLLDFAGSEIQEIRKQSIAVREKLDGLAETWMFVDSVPESYLIAVEALRGIFPPSEQLDAALELVDLSVADEVRAALATGKVRERIVNLLPRLMPPVRRLNIVEPTVQQATSKLNSFVQTELQNLPSYQELLAHSGRARVAIIRYYLDSVEDNATEWIGGGFGARLRATLQRELDIWLEGRQWPQGRGQDFRQFVQYLSGPDLSRPYVKDYYLLTLSAIFYDYLLGWNQPGLGVPEIYTNALAFARADERLGAQLRPFVVRMVMTALTSLRPTLPSSLKVGFATVIRAEVAVVRRAYLETLRTPNSAVHPPRARRVRIASVPEISPPADLSGAPADELEPFLRGFWSLSDIEAGRPYQFVFKRPIAGLQGVQQVVFSEAVLADIKLAVQDKQIDWIKWLGALQMGGARTRYQSGVRRRTVDQSDDAFDVKVVSSPWRMRGVRENGQWKLLSFDNNLQ